MKIKLVRFVGVAAAMLIGSSVGLLAGEAAKEVAAIVSRLISALEQSDYATFVAGGDAPFKELKKEKFDAVGAQLGPKLKEGHKVLYLGELRQKGYHVTLWKLSFKDGSDDALVTLSVKDGKVGGFWIK